MAISIFFCPTYPCHRCASIAYDFSCCECKIDEQLVGKPLIALTALLQMEHENFDYHLSCLQIFGKTSGSFVIALFFQTFVIRNIRPYSCARHCLQTQLLIDVGLQLRSLP
jgi:hypothetical protein